MTFNYAYNSMRGLQYLYNWYNINIHELYTTTIFHRGRVTRTTISRHTDLSDEWCRPTTDIVIFTDIQQRTRAGQTFALLPKHDRLPPLPLPAPCSYCPPCMGARWTARLSWLTPETVARITCCRSLSPSSALRPHTTPRCGGNRVKPSRLVLQSLSLTCVAELQSLYQCMCWRQRWRWR